MPKDRPPRRNLRFPPRIWTPALRLARDLGETQPAPRFQIATIIQQLGLNFAERVLEQTWEVEAQGGLLVPNGSRRRTPGGVFFTLAREQMTEDQQQAVFMRPKADVFRWTQRRDVVEPLLVEAGQVESVEVTLVGRPEEIWEYDDVVILRMAYAGVQPPTPQGVPQLQLLSPEAVVFVSPDQWLGILPALDNDQTMLVVEGPCAFEADVGGLAVYAQKVTTTQLKKRKPRKK
ncbi:MAG: hypothetical protein K8J31_05430 [Anaerolineae bacterium]|nr:hypothetical protein [Anaerolineae bacterium]